MKKIYLFAICMAIIVGIAVYFFASSLEQNINSESNDLGQVVVAVSDIPAKYVLSQKIWFELAELPSQSINYRAVTSLDQVLGKITKYPLLTQEQVLSPDLLEKGTENGSLSYTLDDGKRAISVSVDDVSGVSGYIAQGDFVEVAATVILYDETGKSYTASTLIAENIPVLKTGVKQLSSTDSISESYTTVTLCATPEQALKINYAATNGSLCLILRPVLDNKVVNPPTYPSS